MPGPANIVPTSITDGTVYCTNVPLTSTEASLGDNKLSTDPIAIIEGQAIIAIVTLNINGLLVALNSYVVMQTDLGDGVWIDVCWFVYKGTVVNSLGGGANFIMSGGGFGPMSNPLQQLRQPGSFPNPQNAGSNVMSLGGRVRFVGSVILLGGSSSLAGTTAGLTATIKYKLVTPR